MHDPSITNPAYRSLTDRQLAEMDELCELFERELVNGRGPRIEISLAQAPEAARDGLLAELLAMEFEYRTQQGDAPVPEEYLRRFPQQKSVIASVFASDAATQFQFPGHGTISIPVNVPPVLANFRLIEELGRGGMGVVWLAEQIEPVKRRVALKLIKSELTAKEVIARFDVEKHALAMMDHHNIARVLDAGTTDDGRPYFVMELVDGIPITQYCDDNKLSVDERLKLFVPVCKAVQHAHQKGIIHRDLKPSNVLVTVIDGEAVPKVIDFGLAKAVEQNVRLSDMTMQTEFGKIVGTVQYMSPEQAELKGPEAEDIDTRTDVYSLGVMLYELLTGSTPLDKETLGRSAVLKILQIIREEDPPRPSHRLSRSSNELNSAVSERCRMHPARLRQLLRGELDWVVMKALEKEPDRRYQTANDLAQDLSNFLTGEAVAARPPSTWYQVQKFATRNRGLVAAMLAIGVVLLGGIAGTTYGLIRANEKTAEAEVERGKANASAQRAFEEKDKAQSNERRAIEAEKVAEDEARRARDAETNATFQLAVARYDAGRAGEARSLLHQIPLEFRDNFEWRHCNRRFQGSDMTCYGHAGTGGDGGVHAVAFSPDGRWFASAGGDMTIKLWDSTTGQELATLEGHEGGVLTLAVSSDGTQIASAGNDKKIKLWDVESRQEVFTLSGHSGVIRCVAFSPRGDRLASASDDRTVKLWDVATREELTTIARHTDAVLGVAFCPDGKLLASVGRDKLIRIWDVQSGERIAELSRHRNELYSVAFSPDGTRLIATSLVYVSIWNTQTWQFVAESGFHNGGVPCVAFRPDGTQFATGADDTTIKLWDAQSGVLIKTLSGHSESVRGVDFSPDGSRLVSGSQDGTVKIWDTRGDNALTLKEHRGQLHGVAFSSDGKQLASGGSSGTIILWNAETNEALFTKREHTGGVNGLSFSRDGMRLASAGDDHTVRLWDTRTGQQVAVLKGHTGWVRGVAFRPDGTGLASAGSDGTIKLWDAQTSKETATLKGHRSVVYSVAFSPDGTRLASGSSDNTVKLWDARSGAEIRTFTGHIARVRSVAFDRRGERLVSAGYDPKIRVWNVASGEQIATAIVSSGATFGIAISPDGKRIAVGGTDRAVRLYDAFGGREIMTFPVNGGVGTVTFSPDGTRLAAAVHDGSVRIWDASQQHETTVLSGHADTITKVTFSTDGSRIYSASGNEKLVWDVATRETIPDASWKPPRETTPTSPDQRWFVTTESNNVVLVDQEFRSTPGEKNYRLTKARFDPVWHQEQASAATAAADWYSAVFHYAWLMKHDPNQASYYDDLRSSLQKLKSQFEQEGRDVEPHLARVVKKALQCFDD